MHSRPAHVPQPSHERLAQYSLPCYLRLQVLPRGAAQALVRARPRMCKLLMSCAAAAAPTQEPVSGSTCLWLLPLLQGVLSECKVRLVANEVLLDVATYAPTSGTHTEQHTERRGLMLHRYVRTRALDTGFVWGPGSLAVDDGPRTVKVGQGWVPGPCI